jgi:prolycopene isomerase
MNKKNVGIIGAGIGGLTSGALLTKKGFKVKIFEKENLIGGRALNLDASSLTLDVYKNLLSRFHMSVVFSEPKLETIFNKNMLNGYKLDLGYHAIGGGVLSNVNSILSEFDSHVDILESRVGLIDEDGYHFPWLSRIDKIKILPNILRLVFASEETMKKLDRTSMTETIKKYGKGKMKLILEIFSRSITTINNLDQISTGEMFRAQKNLYKGSKPVGYPKGGLISITKMFTDYITQNGGEIFLGTPVKKIIIDNGKASGILVRDDEYDFDIIISDIPVQYLFNIADEKHFPDEYVKEIKSLIGTGSLCAYYSLKKMDPILTGKTFHFIERDIGIDGDDAVGMIDFMTSSNDAGISPLDSYLVQSYLICTPDEAKNPIVLKKLRELLDKNLELALPNFRNHINWAIYTAIWHLDGVAKTIFNDKPEIKTPVDNLYLVGDCVKAPGIGFNCALNSAKILNDMLSD